MHGDGPDAPVHEVLHLVFHEGDERSNDQADALPHEARHLEAYALAPARGQDGQDVAPFQCLVDDFLLHGPETVVTPVSM